MADWKSLCSEASSVTKKEDALELYQTLQEEEVLCVFCDYEPSAITVYSDIQTIQSMKIINNSE